MDGRSAPDLPKLLPGDPVPALNVKFLKGPPIDALVRGTVYGLEFWASWSHEVVQHFPRLSKLQQENPDVVIIGVGISDTLSALTAAVAKHGSQRDYRIAADVDNSMEQNWFKAAGRFGVPDSLIVDAEGRLAWAGYTPRIALVLPLVKAGTWDLDAYRADYLALWNDPLALWAKTKERYQIAE